MVFDTVTENEWHDVVDALPKPWPEAACRIDFRMLRKSRRPGAAETLRELGVRWGVSKTTASRYIERSGVR